MADGSVGAKVGGEIGEVLTPVATQMGAPQSPQSPQIWGHPDG